MSVDDAPGPVHGCKLVIRATAIRFAPPSVTLEICYMLPDGTARPVTTDRGRFLGPQTLCAGDRITLGNLDVSFSKAPQ